MLWSTSVFVIPAKAGTQCLSLIRKGTGSRISFRDAGMTSKIRASPGSYVKQRRNRRFRDRRNAPMLSTSIPPVLASRKAGRYGMRQDFRQDRWWWPRLY